MPVRSEPDGLAEDLAARTQSTLRPVRVLASNWTEEVVMAIVGHRSSFIAVILDWKRIACMYSRQERALRGEL